MLPLYLGRTFTGWIAPAFGWRTHSITSSAATRRFWGTAMSIALAAFRLITSSYLVGCWTGNGHAGASAASAIKERLSLTLSAEPAYADTVFNLARRCFGCCIRVLPCIAKRHNDLRSDHDSNSRTHKQNDPDSDVMQVARAFMPIAPSGPSSHDPCRCPHIQKNGPGIDHRNNHEGHAAETQAMCAPDITSRRKQRPCDSQAVS
jgi:hypothetical protein